MFVSLLSWVFLQISANPRHSVFQQAPEIQIDQSLIAQHEKARPTRGWMKVETNGGVLRVGLNDNSFWGRWRLLLETSWDHSFSFKRFFVFVEVPNKHDEWFVAPFRNLSKVTRNIVSLMTHLECHPGIQMTLGWGFHTVKRRHTQGQLWYFTTNASVKHLKGRLIDPKFRSYLFGLNVDVQGGDTTSFSPNPRFLVSQALVPTKAGPFLDTGAARCSECGHQRWWWGRD